MGEIRAITEIQIDGLDFYYDTKEEKVGFPKWYNQDTHNLDLRVGHQYWIPTQQAKAIIRDILQKSAPCLKQESDKERVRK